MKDIESKIEVAFEKMQREYEEFFNVFYPGKESAGFNESNLVCKFASNYKIINEKSIYWNELSIGKYKDRNGNEKIGRIDGLIIDNDSVIFIEAKRINSDKKVKSLAADFARTYDECNRKKIIYPLEKNNHYILLLVDIWNESANNNYNWTDNWSGEDNPIYKNIADRDNIEWVKHSIHSFEQVNLSTTINKYNLCYSLYKIK